MGDNMRLFLELGTKTRGLVRGLRDSSGHVRKFVGGAKKELAELRGMFGGIQGHMAGLGLSIGTGKLVLDSGRLDRSLTKVGQTAGGTSRHVRQLRQDLFGMGRESGKVIENLEAGFNNLVQAGLNMKQATESMWGVNVAMAVSGSGAAPLTSGLTVGAEFFKFDLAKPGMALEILDKMTVAGRLGKAELEDLAKIFSDMAGEAKDANLNFDKTLAFVEGLSQVQQQPEKLATLARSTLRVFTNLRYMAEAQKGTGVSFFDGEGTRRDAFDVLEDIKKKYDTLTTDKQRAGFIHRAFGKSDQDTIKGIRELLKGDALIRLHSYTEQIQEASGTLRRDFDAATSNLPDQMNMLKNDLRAAADGFIQPMNATLAEWIKWTRADKSQGGLGMDGKDMILGGTALVAGTVLTARYGGKAAGKFLKGGGDLAAGIAKGKAVEAATGVTPVFVTNWPNTPGNGMLEDLGLGKGRGKAGKGKGGGFGKTKLGKSDGWFSKKFQAGGKWIKSFGTSLKTPALTLGGAGLTGTLGGVAGVTAAGLGGYEIGTWINQLSGWLAGKATDGKYSGEGWLGSWLYDVMHKKENTATAPAVNQNKINLTLSVDQNGRVFTRSDDRNTTVDVKRGRFF